MIHADRFPFVAVSVAFTVNKQVSSPVSSVRCPESDRKPRCVVVVRRSLGLCTAVWRTSCSMLNEEEEHSSMGSHCGPLGRKVTSYL